MPRIPDAIYYDHPDNIIPDTELVLLKCSASSAMLVAERALYIAEQSSGSAAVNSAYNAREYLRAMRALTDEPCTWVRRPLFYDTRVAELYAARKAQHCPVSGRNNSNSNSTKSTWQYKTYGEIKHDILTKLDSNEVYRWSDIITFVPKRHATEWLNTIAADGLLTIDVLEHGNRRRFDYRKTAKAESSYPYDGYQLERKLVVAPSIGNHTDAEIAERVNTALSDGAWLDIRALRERVGINLNTLRSNWLVRLRAAKLIAYKQQRSKHGASLMYLYHKL